MAINKKQLEILKAISHKKNIHPPRALWWASYEIMNKGKRNTRIGSKGWFTFFDTLRFLHSNRDKYFRFLEKHSMTKEPYDVYLPKDEEDDGKDHRTSWQ
jgi:hypothetical protein